MKGFDLFKVENFVISGIKLIHNIGILDLRGEFKETYHQKKFEDFGISTKFVQLYTF